MQRPVASETELTPCERTALTACATGLGIVEAAELLRQSPEDIRQSITAAITKLGARSKLEAVVIALRRGLITLSVV